MKTRTLLSLRKGVQGVCCRLCASWSIALSVALIAVPSVSLADVIAGNIAGSPGYDNTQGQTVGNDGVGDNLAFAIAFTPTVTSNLSSIRVAVDCTTGGCADPISVVIAQNSAGVPGAVIETLSFPGNSSPIESVNSGTNPLLSAGTQYWLALETTTNNSNIWYSDTNDDTTLPTAESFNGGLTWSAGLYTNTAFEIDGTPVRSTTPEPASVCLVLASGLVIMAAGRKLRRN